MESGTFYPQAQENRKILYFFKKKFTLNNLPQKINWTLISVGRSFLYVAPLLSVTLRKMYLLKSKETLMVSGKTLRNLIIDITMDRIIISCFRWYWITNTPFIKLKALPLGNWQKSYSKILNMFEYFRYFNFFSFLK